MTSFERELKCSTPGAGPGSGRSRWLVNTPKATLWGRTYWICSRAPSPTRRPTCASWSQTPSAFLSRTIPLITFFRGCRLFASEKTSGPSSSRNWSAWQSLGDGWSWVRANYYVSYFGKERINLWCLERFIFTYFFTFCFFSLLLYFSRWWRVASEPRSAGAQIPKSK